MELTLSSIVPSAARESISNTSLSLSENLHQFDTEILCTFPFLSSLYFFASHSPAASTQ